MILNNISMDVQHNYCSTSVYMVSVILLLKYSKSLIFCSTLQYKLLSLEEMGKSVCNRSGTIGKLSEIMVTTLVFK